MIANGPTIVLFGGWFGSRNAGDEAIMLGNLEILRRLVPTARIRVHSIDAEFTRSLSDIDAIAVKHLKSRLAKAIHLFREYSNADLFVVTGGTPIFDFRLSSRLFHLGVPVLSRVPIVWLAVGMKPIVSRRGRAFYRSMLGFAEHVSVRDPEVAQGLRAIGYRGPIDLTVDSAIMMPISSDAQLDLREDVGATIREPFVVFAPIFLSALDPDSHYHEPVTEAEIECGYAAMARAADFAVERGYAAMFVPMHQVPPDDDRLAIGLVRDRMKRESTVLGVSGDPRLTSEIISRAHLLIGMRLHSLVLATARGTPAIGIGFDMKVGGYMRYVGLGEYVRPLSELDDGWLLGAFEKLLAERDRTSDELRARMTEWSDVAIRTARNALTAAGLLETTSARQS